MKARANMAKAPHWERYLMLAVVQLVALGLAIPVSVEAQSPTPIPSSTRQQADYFRVPLVAPVARNANLRAGPGTEFEIVGSAVAGEVITGVACDDQDDCDWFMLADGRWIATSLVGWPIGTATPTPRPRATPTRTPVVTLAPMTIAEAEYVARVFVAYDAITEETTEHLRYLTMATSNLGVMDTVLWQTGVLNTLRRAVEHVRELRMVPTPASNPPLVAAVDAFLDSVESWAIKWEAFVWSDSDEDWDVTRNADDARFDATDALLALLESQNQRYTDYINRSKMLTGTPRPTARPGSANPFGRPSATPTP